MDVAKNSLTKFSKLEIIQCIYILLKHFLRKSLYILCIYSVVQCIYTGLSSGLRVMQIVGGPKKSSKWILKILQMDLEDFWVNPNPPKGFFLEENGFFGFFWNLKSEIWIFWILKDFLDFHGFFGFSRIFMIFKDFLDFQRFFGFSRIF